MVEIRIDDILNAAIKLLNLDDTYIQMAKAVNPYGNGNALQQIYEALCKWENGINDEIP